ncbi:MAG: IS110 family transposase [Lewinellaceae bacterium]|nr:IS110 family transposase [Lewinellaceae bacterium]MCB9036048.1 IS110 family transposase [Lewinellaceae bacterium]MCB9036537.1 IS110 family transposase [Lewinellaceae bacterium]MCB9036573.1 IS110 family transposase [Lewinellaceae bacterium]MCB9038350.1 IS110 family transposase [Lewinellaceae bacterium]
MDTLPKTFIGIDVSKDDLVTAFPLAPEQWEVDKFDNNDAGIAALLQKVKELPKPHVVLEATGNYSMKVVFALCENQVPVSVLNPKQSNGFIKGVLLSTTKTDAKDACALALYGQFNKPKSYRIPSDKMLEITQLRVYLKQLKKQQVVISNQLHALEFHVKPLPYVQESLRESLALCKRQIQDTEKGLLSISEDCFDQAYALATSVVGVGPAIAQSLLVATNGFREFDNPKQLAKFVGVCSTQCESGSSIKKRGSISKTGDPNLRALLYMGARSAKRFNQPCKLLYERLRSKGKCHKVAMLAVCNKMLRQMFAVVKSGVKFDNEYHLKNEKAA